MLVKPCAEGKHITGHADAKIGEKISVPDLEDSKKIGNAEPVTG
jgi:hypothetical protein